MANSLYGRGLKVGYLMQTGVVDLSEVSGPQLHTLGVIKGLRKQGYAVRVVANQNDKLGWTEDLQTWGEPQYGVTQTRLFRLVESILRRIQTELNLPFLGLFNSLHFADACRTQLDGFNVLYERHGYMGFGGVIAARWLGIPLILELNGNILREIDERKLSFSLLQRKIGRWVTIQTFLAADQIVAVSDALSQILIDEYHIPAGKISVILNGVDVDLFSSQNISSDIRFRFGLGSGPMVGFVGSFEPWHGVGLLVSAFQEVNRKHPDCHLVIIGEGPDKNEVVAQVEYLGLADKVKFLGRLPQPQVAELLGALKVLVAPYPFEDGSIVGTPLKIMEYMASGKGIVASTAPLHEIIEHEVTGLRVTPANVQSLADGIIRLIEDDELCSTLGKNAAACAQYYSWDQVSIKIAEIFFKEIDKRNK